jgi:hypothetical protein
MNTDTPTAVTSKKKFHSLAATQPAWIKGSARIGSGSSGGLLVHTFPLTHEKSAPFTG